MISAVAPVAAAFRKVLRVISIGHSPFLRDLLPAILAPVGVDLLMPPPVRRHILPHIARRLPARAATPGSPVGSRPPPPSGSPQSPGEGTGTGSGRGGSGSRGANEWWPRGLRRGPDPGQWPSRGGPDARSEEHTS